MSHPDVDNGTPFAFEALFTSDEEAVPVVIPLVQATYEIRDRGRLALSEEQRPVNLGGEHWGPPERSSYKYEPQIAFAAKPATDVVLIGHAVAPRGVARELDVSLRIGRLQKAVRVLGDRIWVRRLGGAVSPTSPEPFERMPLRYERAFGGWDRSAADPAEHRCEPRNPVGQGFRRGSFAEGVALPNLEDPRRPVRSFGDAPPPAGFGFVSPGWEPRSALAGTYDDEWTRSRMPALPADFDRRFFNASSAELCGPLNGDEPVAVHGTTSDGDLSFRLPQVPSPVCTVALSRQEDRQVNTKLDTVVIDTDERVLLLLWRGVAPLSASPHQVRAIRIVAEGIPVFTQPA
jgi:hypothetical protein